MSKNREPVKPVEPETDFSEEEEEDDEGSTEVSESELEPNQLTKKPSPPQPESFVDEESGSESESESESDSVRKVTSVSTGATIVGSKPVTPAEEEDDDEGSTEVSESEPELNQLTKTPSPPQPDPSEDEEKSVSESEPEPNQLTKKPSPPMPVAAAAKTPAASKPPQPEPSGSESESDSNLKVTSVAMNDVLKSSTGATISGSKPAVTPSKRRVAEENPKKSKKQKMADPETSVKIPRFQRLWSEEDEIVLIKGMIDYSEKKKGDPINNADSFLELIKNRLKIVKLTKTQLLAKMRRIKHKYENNTSKERTTFSNPHEQNAFELSKVLWGKEKVKKENRGERVVKYGVVEDRILLMGEQLFEEGILGKEWEKLKREECELYARLMNVKARLLKIVMDNSK